jgi:hypothetical protein
MSKLLIYKNYYIFIQFKSGKGSITAATKFKVVARHVCGHFSPSTKVRFYLLLKLINLIKKKSGQMKFGD